VAAGGSNDSSLVLAPRKWRRFCWKPGLKQACSAEIEGELRTQGKANFVIFYVLLDNCLPVEEEVNGSSLH